MENETKEEKEMNEYDELSKDHHIHIFNIQPGGIYTV
jgi:hypothetical protein